jgi:hypothetical protein
MRFRAWPFVFNETLGSFGKNAFWAAEDCTLLRALTTGRETEISQPGIIDSILRLAVGSFAAVGWVLTFVSCGYERKSSGNRCESSTAVRRNGG